MKREIKFRLWHKEEKFMLNIWPYEWLTGHWAGSIDRPSEYFDNEFDITPDGKNCNRIKGKSVFMTIDGQVIGVLPFDEKTTRSVNYSDQYEIMQFTGLQDKNGKDIYEGDICRRQLDEDNRYHSNGKWCDIWLIEWLEKTAGFTTTKVADYNAHLKKIVKILHKQNSFSQRFHELEVIGNIYENPDLISD